MALDAFLKGEYDVAIPLYEGLIVELKHARGECSVELFSVMEKLAICYSKNANDYGKAICINEDRLKKMSLFFGECYPATLSAMYCLAEAYSKEDHFLAVALSLHEDCFAKRSIVLGDSSRYVLILLCRAYNHTV